MEKLTTVKLSFISIIGIIGSMIANLLGGWDMALQILIIFMGIDYITGLVVAGVFKKSTKTETGALESKAGAQGLARKGMTLLIVLVATQLDKLSGTEIIRDAVIIGYIANEAVSIIENAGLMGVPIPQPIKNAINILKSKTETEGGSNE
jgi:toxin secretion/phage lysis holin